MSVFKAKVFVTKHEKRHGKSKALSILAYKLGRAVYADAKIRQTLRPGAN